MENTDKPFNQSKNNYKREGILQSEQPPPHDLNLEKAVLGAMLLENDARAIAIERISSSSDFYFPSHQKFLMQSLIFFQSMKTELIYLQSAFS